MSPKSKISVHPSEDVPIVPASESPKEPKIVGREYIFSRIDKPLYLEQHIFHIIWIGIAHSFAAYYFYLDITSQVPRSQVLFELFYGYLGGLGITVGCHRYWTHKTFKANLPLQILLMLMQTIANQHPIHKWSLDHRIHHKYTDTDADPHNSKKGFWFSHMGWFFVPKSKDVQKKIATFDMSDLENDPVVRFQSRWYWTLTAILHFIVPITAIHFIWDMPLLYCVAANYRRYVMSLHFTWCVNSVAHIWGDKPYDKSITASENPVVSMLTVGEGWHNYHHTFPWDYQASEYGWKINASTMFIDFFAWLGWAYDLKTVSQKLLKERLQRTGDGSHIDAIRSPTSLEEKTNNKSDFEYKTPNDVTELMKSVDHHVWGWDDDDLHSDLRQVTKILRPKPNQD